MRSIWNDVRYAFRTLSKAPAFVLVTVATLVLGIGANTAIFSLVDVVLFRELPIEQPSRVVRLFGEGNDPGGLSSSSFPSYRDYRERARSFSSLAAYSSGMAMNLAPEGFAPDRIAGAIVTGEFFDTVGVRAALGRMIEPQDARVRGEGAVVVLSHHLWSRQFGADPSVLGTTVRINAHPFTIVGVAPPSFWGLDFDEPADLWIPSSMTAAAVPDFPAEMLLDDRRVSWLDVVGRLREGVSIEQAGAEVRTIGITRAATQDEKDPLGTLRPAAAVALGTSDTAATMKKISWILFAVVAVVLLIACANVAGLMLVRSEKRRQGLAVRLALGSSRWRVARQILIEAVLIAGAGGIGAVVFSFWSVRLFVAAIPPDWPFPFDATADVVDLRVLAATVAIALGAGLAFGALPAFRVSSRDPLASMQNQAARGSSRSRLGRTFVVTQVTLAAVLLVVAGLLVRTLWNMRAVDPGFDPDAKIVATIDLGTSGYELDAIPALWDRVLDETRATPGVASAALARNVPVQRTGMRHSVVVEGYSVLPGVFPNVDFNIISPGYFEALGVPLLRGRTFTSHDDENGRPVAVINQAMAEQFWRGRDPIGAWIGEVEAEVVGIVADVRSRSVREPAPPTVFRPMAQLKPMSPMTLLVSSAQPPDAALRTLRLAIDRVDPDLPLFATSSLREKLGDAVAQERLIASLIGGFAALALVLAVGGLYALIAYRTETRRREFGIRMALGADRRAIVDGVLRESVSWTAAGTLAGIAIGALAARFAETLLYEVRPWDAGTFVVVALVLLAAAIVAGGAPARRAASTDPAVVLRQE